MTTSIRRHGRRAWQWWLPPDGGGDDDDDDDDDNDDDVDDDDDGGDDDDDDDDDDVVVVVDGGKGGFVIDPLLTYVRLTSGLMKHRDPHDVVAETHAVQEFEQLEDTPEDIAKV